jgi:hypothetical protein
MRVILRENPEKKYLDVYVLEPSQVYLKRNNLSTDVKKVVVRITPIGTFCVLADKQLILNFGSAPFYKNTKFVPKQENKDIALKFSQNKAKSLKCMFYKSKF